MTVDSIDFVSLCVCVCMIQCACTCLYILVCVSEVGFSVHRAGYGERTAGEGGWGVGVTPHSSI